ncbi:MAG: oxygenase MpaB family protein [Chloroflexota bacterium]
MAKQRIQNDQWNDRLLDQMREAADPVADQLIAELVSQDQLREVNFAIRQIVANLDQPPSNLHPEVARYFEETAALPAFADHSKIKIAQRIYQLYSMEIGLLLMYASLPACYAARKGAQVLMLTERMAKQKEAYNRLAETGQFVWDVMSPGGFEPTGKAIRSAQKVRLVHAVVRHHIAKADQKDSIWEDDWGVPINQEDEVGTLLAFSYYVIEGLQKIGIKLSQEEIDAFFHLWRVVGIILGIEPALIPENYASATQLAEAIATRHFEESLEGKALTRVILNMLEESVSRERFKKMPHVTMRYLLGDEVADILGVDPPDWTAGLVKVRFAFLELGDGLRHSNQMPVRLFGQLGREVIGRVNYGLMSGMVSMQQAGLGSQFELPSTLRLTRALGPMQTAMLQAGEATLNRMRS